MDREDRRDAAVAGGDLLQRQRVADMVGAGPAIFGRHQRAHKPELAELGQCLFRKAGLAVPFRRVRREQVPCDIVRRVAQEDLLIGEPHSMTSSACASSTCGTVRPSALAVFRLMTNSNLVGCWTGRSAGLAPFRTLPE